MKDVYLSENAGEPLIEFLNDHEFTLHFMNGEHTPVYREVSTHADIHMCQLGLWDKARLFMGHTEKLGESYPENIIYNAVCTSGFFIHNLRYTDPALLSQAMKTAAQKVHVTQGYSRCCCLPVDDNSFITSDAGIAKALSVRDAHVLFIQKGHILLPGFDYGFIGGCAGHLTIDGKRTIIFNGNLNSHPDADKIAAFIRDRGIEIVYFDSFPLEDIGSILTGHPEAEPC